MSTTIDERVVSLQFDNKQFENNVQTTMSTLDKLKESLKLKGSAKAAQSEFASYESGAFKFKDSILKSFSSLEYEIGNRMKNILKWLNPKTAFLEVLDAGIQSAKAGMSEYELKMNSVQTIMSSTGEEIGTVNSYLNELNEYSDKTIYSFQDMTSNIGKFTNAGVSLKDSVAAIKGVSNVAALSGANANEASRAMYNFSQALSSGYVKLIDWKSIENANMATVEFKEQLLETAVAQGTLKKASDGTYKTLKGTVISATKGFNDSLQQQWMTSEVLTKTLNNYADETTEIGQRATEAATKVKTFSQLFDTLKEAAQSGWAQTWELLVGDLEEAKDFLTYLSDVLGGIIGKSSDARNELLSNWKALGGRDDLINSIKNVIKAISGIVKPVKEAFQEMFPPMTGDALFKLTEKIRELTEKLIVSEEVSDKLKRTFKGIFAIVKIVMKVLGGLFTVVKKVVGAIGIGGLGGGLLDATASLGDWLVHIAECIESSKTLGKVFDFIGNGLAFVVKVIKGAISIIADTFIFPHFDTLEAIVELFRMIGRSAEESFSGAGETFAQLKESFVNSGFYSFLKTLWEIIKVIGNAINTIFVKVISSLTQAFAESDADTIFKFLEALSKGGIAMGLFRIGKYLGLFGSNFESLIPSIKEFLDTLRGQTEGVEEESFGTKLLKIAGAIAILAAAMWLLSTIETEKLIIALVGITALFAEMFIMLKIIGKTLKISDKIGASSRAVDRMTTAMLKMAGAVLILVLALKVIATLNWEQLGVGLVGLTVTLGLLVGALAVLSLPIFSKGIPKNTTSQMTKMAIALLVVAGVLKIFATLSWAELGLGLTAMGATLIIMTGAMVALSLANAKAKGLGNNPGNQLLAVSKGLVLVALSLKILATMSWEDVLKSLVALTAALTAMSVAVLVAGKSAAGGYALKQLASGILILSAAFVVLSLLSWEGIAKSLVAIVGALVALGAAAIILTPFVGTIYAISTAFKFMGAAVLMIGAGVLTFAVGLGVLAANILVLSASIDLIAALITATVAGLISGVVAGLGAGIVAICKIIAGSVDVICEAIESIITAACTALRNSVKTILDTVLGIVLDVLSSLVENAGPIVSKVLELVIVIVEALIENIQPIVNVVVNLFMALIKGLIDALNSSDISGLKDMAEAILTLTAMMAGLAAIAGMIPAASAGVAALTLILTEITAMLVLFGALNEIPGLNEMIANGGEMLEAIGVAIGKFAGGIAGGALEALAESLSKIDGDSLDGAMKLAAVITVLTANNLLDAITTFFTGKSAFDTFQEDAIALGKGIAGFSEAVKGRVDVDACSVAAEALKTLIAATESIPKTGGLMGLLTGNQDLGNFGTGLKDLGEGIANFSGAVSGKVDESSVNIAIKALKSLVEMTKEIPESGGWISKITGDASIKSFGEDIPELGRGIAGFSEAVKGNIDPANVTAGIVALKALANLAQDIPNTGGLIASLLGDNDLSDFGDELPKLGKGVAGFSSEVSGKIDVNSVTSAIIALKSLAKMGQEVDNAGGLIAGIVGDNDLSDFGDELPKLGKGIAGFSSEVSGKIDALSVYGATGALTSLAQMAKDVPNAGGLIAGIVGDNDLDKFGDKLPKLGAGIAGFSSEVSGNVDITACGNAISAIKDLVGAVEAVKTVTGAFSTTGIDLQVFSNGLDRMGSGLYNFSWYMSYISVDAINNGIDVASKLVDTTKDVRDMVGIFTNVKMETFASALFNLGWAIKQFSDQLNGINVANVDAGSLAAKRLGEMVKALPAGINMDRISKFADRLEDLGDEIRACFTKLSGLSTTTVNNSVNAINAIKQLTKIDSGKLDNVKWSLKGLYAELKDIVNKLPDDYSKAGEKVITGFVNGIKDNLSSVKKAAKNLKKAALPDISTKKGVFYNAGSDLVTGFANGISANTYKAEARAKAMAAAAAEAARKELDEHSPSKVGYEIGDFFGVAFVNGIGDNVENAYGISMDMAKSAKRGLTSAISKVNDLIINDIDSQPTIRPVLDLSDVQSGVNAIGSMFGSGAAVGVMANIGSISSMMNKHGQNGTNADVIAAIDKLRRDIGNINNNTYTIGGITYDDSSNVSDAVKSLIRATRIERRV